ncbi:MAG: helix-hairpin-helix domain-containing protein [Anaerolineae bacterium]|nr:helix-hairpin-helix domain-containing protein [Anaerolineae bacterium]
MDIHQKIDTLGRAAALDCEGPPLVGRQQRKAQMIAECITYVTHPQKGKMPVLRIMQTSACERNCYYCPFQTGRNYQRVSLTPEELAAAFDQMQRKKLVDGLFLSSGVIGGGAKVMDKMLATVELVRRKYEYLGYVHLKIMPGAESAQIEQAARLADRLSINLEGANESRLALLAPKKDFWHELLPPLYWLRQNQNRLEPWVKRPSLSTQFVVGPAGEADRELLTTVSTLYQEAKLVRAYYSAFNPAKGTTFEDRPKTPEIRQHRLYQADWLLRFYGFNLNELPFDASGNLPPGNDPKLVWAQQHLHQPVEINRASRAELLRVPGIGPKSADAIIAARREGRLNEAQQLNQLGVWTVRAAPYILLNGRQPGHQLRLPGV